MTASIHVLRVVSLSFMHSSDRARDRHIVGESGIIGETGVIGESGYVGSNHRHTAEPAALPRSSRSIQRNPHAVHEGHRFADHHAHGPGSAIAAHKDEVERARAQGQRAVDRQTRFHKDEVAEGARVLPGPGADALAESRAVEDQARRDIVDDKLKKND
jgi:hypothetical protein